MCRLLSPRRWWLIVMSISWLSVTTAWGAEPLDAVPDSATAVLRLKAPQATLNKLFDFVNEVQPGFGEAFRNNLDIPVGLAISNPTLAGVDVEKDLWAIVFAESRQKPTVVFVVPATDAAAVKDALLLPPGFSFHTADKLAIYSEDEAALGKVRDRLSGKGAALWSKSDAASKKLFEAADVSVLIHVRQLAKSFDAELQQAEPQLDALLKQITTLTPESQRQQIEMAFDMYRSLAKVALQGVRDSNTLTLGVSFSKEAIRFEDRLTVAKGTATAKFLSGQPTGELSLMSQLPANKLSYFGVKADMAGGVEWLLNMSKSWFVGTSDEAKAAFDEGTKQLRGLKWGEMAGYFDLDPNATGAMRGASVIEIAPTKGLREITRKMFQAMGEINTGGIKQTMTLEPAVEKIGGVDVDRLTMKQEIDPALDPLGIQQKISTLLYGPDGMRQLILYQATRSLQTFGGGKPEMENLVTALNSTTSKDADVTAARKRFLEKANLIALTDVARLMANGIKLAVREKALPFAIDDAMIDGLQLQPSFIGIAFACEPTAAQFQLEIPAAQAQGIAKLVTLIMTQARPPQ